MMLPELNRRSVDSPFATTRTKSLALFVIHVVDRLHPHPAARIPVSDIGIAFEPRVLLAIITYCYAAGVFASEDIETAMRDDPGFCALCHNVFPDAASIRRFRRLNRDSIERCLAGLLAALELEPNAPALELARPGLPSRAQTSEGRAAELVEQAMFIDLMSDENS
jgi:hypothetical protein